MELQSSYADLYHYHNSTLSRLVPLGQTVAQRQDNQAWASYNKTRDILEVIFEYLLRLDLAVDLAQREGIVEIPILPLDELFCGNQYQLAVLIERINDLFA